MGQLCGYGLIPDRGPNCGRRSVQTRICPYVDPKLAARQEVAASSIDIERCVPPVQNLELYEYILWTIRLIENRRKLANPK